MRRSPIPNKDRDDRPVKKKVGFQKGQILPHVKEGMEYTRQKMLQSATVTREQILAEGISDEPIRSKDRDTRGLDTLCTPAITEEICRRLANGELLKRICKDAHMPAEVTVRAWVLNIPYFRDKYRQAMTIRVEKMAEEIIEISDDRNNDYVQYENGKGETKTVLDHEHIRRSELKVETRKWIMGKLNPQKWGNKTEITGPEGGPIQHQHAVRVVLPHNGRNIIDVSNNGD